MQSDESIHVRYTQALSLPWFVFTAYTLFHRIIHGATKKSEPLSRFRKTIIQHTIESPKIAVTGSLLPQSEAVLPNYKQYCQPIYITHPQTAQNNVLLRYSLNYLVFRCLNLAR